jgi:hypothetical protein
MNLREIVKIPPIFINEYENFFMCGLINFNQGILEQAFNTHITESIGYILCMQNEL